MNDLPKVYILGASGYIGAAFLASIKNEKISIARIGRSSEDDVYLDLSDEVLSLDFTFKENSKLIFLSAISSPDQCENDFEYAYRVNVTNTVALIEKALSEGVGVLFASTDAVYGDSVNEVDEFSDVSPVSAYGKMKSEVESVFFGKQGFSSARFSYVWSLSDKFTKAVINASSSGEKFQAFDPLYRSVISLEDVLRFIKKFVQNDGCPGLVNLSGPDLLSRVDLINILKGRIDFDYEVVFPGESFYQSRPKCINMKSKILSGYLGQAPKRIFDVFSKNIIDF